MKPGVTVPRARANPIGADRSEQPDRDLGGGAGADLDRVATGFEPGHNGSTYIACLAAHER